MTKRNILYIAHSARLAGAELSLGLLASNLSEQFHPMVVLPPRGPLKDFLEEKKIPTYSLECLWWIPGYFVPNVYFVDFLAGFTRRIEQLRRLIREREIALVHTNCSTVIDGAVAAYLERVPHVWHIREMLAHPDSGLLCLLGHETVYRIIDALSQKIIAVSQAVEEDMAPFVAGEKIAVVHNGVDAGQFENAQPSPEVNEVLGANRTFKVCTLGNIIERKGYRVLMDAAGHAVARNKNIEFLAAGEAADEDLYRDLLSMRRSMKLERHFHFLGLRGDVPALLQGVDLVVLPSLSDPFPRTVLEAMAAGKPVIVTSAGGGKECVVHGETGFVVEPRDHIDMANHVLDLAAEPDRARQMGARGRERVKASFSIEQYVLGVEEIYRAVLDKAPAFSRRVDEFCGDVIPLLFGISKDLDEVWEEKKHIAAELRELERLRAFEKRVQRQPAYKLYHAMRRFLLKLRGDDTASFRKPGV